MENELQKQSPPTCCIGCGEPMTEGSGFCRRCLDQGHGWIVPSCEGCEGRALEDVEEEQQS
jgi:predicted amidophosphoribosyltransferase